MYSADSDMPITPPGILPALCQVLNVSEVRLVTGGSEVMCSSISRSSRRSFFFFFKMWKLSPLSFLMLYDPPVESMIEFEAMNEDDKC